MKVNVNKNQKTKKLVVLKLNVIRSVDIGEEVRIRVRAKAGVAFRECLIAGIGVEFDVRV